MIATRVFVRFCSLAVNCLIFLLLSAFSCFGQLQQFSIESHDSALKKFIQKELTDPHFGIDKTTRYQAAVIKSDGTTKEEIVVYLSGESWCGSGGCRLWILEPAGASFRIIGEETIVQLPIRVLQSKSHDHFDIGVWVQGGGIQPGYEALVRFDGKSYPDNPSVAPARRLPEGIAERVLISRADRGKLLF
ncbi:MAG: hypothetical protein WAL75_24175 [Terracidiphilus sp.]